MKQKSKADNFAYWLNKNPKVIIAWAKTEIKEYTKLIRIIESSIKPKQTLKAGEHPKLPKTWGKLK